MFQVDTFKNLRELDLKRKVKLLQSGTTSECRRHFQNDLSDNKNKNNVVTLEVRSKYPDLITFFLAQEKEFGHPFFLETGPAGSMSFSNKKYTFGD